MILIEDQIIGSAATSSPQCTTWSELLDWGREGLASARLLACMVSAGAQKVSIGWLRE